MTYIVIDFESFYLEVESYRESLTMRVQMIKSYENKFYFRVKLITISSSIDTWALNDWFLKWKIRTQKAVNNIVELMESVFKNEN
jgi:hypothetical protein